MKYQIIYIHEKGIKPFSVNELMSIIKNKENLIPLLVKNRVA